MDDQRVAQKQQVKDASDIVDVVGGYISLHPTGPTFKGLCPFHEDHRPSLDVDPRRQRFRCWACGKFGDVFSFIQEIERVSFQEALELLARRAGIRLEKHSKSPHEATRALMIDVMRWADEQFHQCLLDSPLADVARIYLGERKLTGETVRRFSLGFAPKTGSWLIERAAQSRLSVDLLEQVGLIAKRTEGPGYYDRFRDRVMFPIRDARGQTVGFGGRILPSSPLSARAPKYYNSSETILFSKSQNLYGIDEARKAAIQTGYIAVVEGYTDVLMAHQMGVPQVVATMGTALNERHVQHLRRLVPKVVLVFDADAGGETGVDRAMQVFLKQEMDLHVATLPDGLDPCDFLLQHGADQFRSALTNAVDLLEFKLKRVLAREANAGVEGKRRAVDDLIGILALIRDPHSVKLELAINRVAHRVGIREETLWSQLRRAQANRTEEVRTPVTTEPEERQARAAPHEVDLLEVLLAEPTLVPVAQQEVEAEEIEHPGLRLLLERLYEMQTRGCVPDLDALRPSIDNPRLAEKALQLQERGRNHRDRAAALQQVIARFRDKRASRKKDEIKDQLHGADDHATAVAL